MAYYYSKIVPNSFDATVSAVVEQLKKEGFGVLTRIDVKQTLKDKLSVDFRKYIILGACNPPFAYKALQAEDKIGVMLPCNVIIQEKSNGDVEVAAIEPLNTMNTVKNPLLDDIATHVSAKLHTVIDAL
ncbi:MAG: DUF302 domain-containing protein [Chitinivibrionales bacterium]|nr:DUF302 domain-containing protein [Chitinivibrionales bacterium]